MRYFIFLLLFSLPFAAGASIAAPISSGETAITQQAIPHGFAQKKQRFGERFAGKMLAKRLKKSSSQPYDYKGRGLCIAGFSIGLLVFLVSVPPLSFALLSNFSFALLISYLLLSLAGLVLSLLGLKKTTGWERSRTIRRLAIAGIVMNGLVIFFFLLLLVGFRGWTPFM